MVTSSAYRVDAVTWRAAINPHRRPAMNFRSPSDAGSKKNVDRYRNARPSVPNAPWAFSPEPARIAGGTAIFSVRAACSTSRYTLGIAVGPAYTPSCSHSARCSATTVSSTSSIRVRSPRVSSTAGAAASGWTHEGNAPPPS